MGSKNSNFYLGVSIVLNWHRISISALQPSERRSHITSFSEQSNQFQEALNNYPVAQNEPLSHWAALLRSLKTSPPRCSAPSPGNWYFIRQRSSADALKDLRLGRLSWVIWVGP